MSLLPINILANGHVAENGADEKAESKQDEAATESNSTKTKSMSNTAASVNENGEAKAVGAKKDETGETENTDPDSSMEPKASNEEEKRA